MSRSLANKAVVWSAIDLFGRQATTFLVSIVLARLLTPSDFGAIAITTLFANFAIVCVQQALATAIVQRHEADDQEVSSIFWWNLIITSVFAATLIAIGPLAAAFFRLPALATLMVAAAAQITFTALGSVHSALLSRALRYDIVAKAGIPATLLSGFIGIAAAFEGMGVWALVAQLVSAAAFNSAGYWILLEWRPAMVLRSAGLSGAARFAGWLSLSGALEVLYTQGFAVFVGKIYGVRHVGLYTRAASTQQLPANVISAVINRVALPLFALRKDDPQALARGLLAANRLAMVLAMPVLVGLALTSDLVIFVLFGPKWVEASPVLAILAWAGVLYPIHANNLQLLLASGRANVFFRVELAKKLFGILLVIWGSTFGIVGLAWSQLAFSAIALVINSAPSAWYFDCGLKRQLVDLRGIAASTGFMAAAILSLRYFAHLTAFAELAVLICAGLLAYSLAGLFLRVDAFKEAIDAVRSLRRQSKSA